MKRCNSCFSKYDDRFSVCTNCGKGDRPPPLEPIHLVPGTILCNRYVIGTAVGAGGFGIVYRAWDQKLDSVVAVKEFFVNRLTTRTPGVPDVIVPPKGKTEFDYRKQRFLAEARTMAKFGAHRNIPNVFEFFEENNTAYIVMELLQGITLSEYIADNGGQVEIDFATMIINEIGNALSSLHKEGIVHCDVAPDNIFLCNGKEIRVKLMDFGAAKLEDNSTDVVDIILKPGYSPTEQYENNKNLGPWTDIYSLGATFYMMLTGTKPEEATNRKIADTLIPPAQSDASINENLSNAIMKALAIDIHMRFRKIEDFLSAVNGNKKIFTLAQEKKRRKARRFVSVAVVLALLITSAGLVVRKFKKAAEEGYLKPATISVWYCASKDSPEQDAMETIAEDFRENFPDVQIELRAIPEEQYVEELTKAAKNNALPDLFESTNLSDEVLQNAKDIGKLLDTEQAEACLFLSQYDDHYEDEKRLPLAIEVPVAYVITAGNTSISYEPDYFTSLSDFGSGTLICADTRYSKMITDNFGTSDFGNIEAFMNNGGNKSPVLLSSTSILNEFRNSLAGYEKKCVFPDTEEIICNFTYEWSIGAKGKNELAAAERFLSWMLGNEYQGNLMIHKCSNGEIPINKDSFNAKVQSKNSKYLLPIKDIYDQFVFDSKQ